MSSGVHSLFSGRLVSPDDLGIQVFERARLDPTPTDELVDLGLLQADDPAESIRGQMPFVDQAVQRPRCEAERRSSFFGGQPIAVGLRHVEQPSNISGPFTWSRIASRRSPIRA
jgi:hypothetical protein